MKQLFNFFQETDFLHDSSFYPPFLELYKQGRHTSLCKLNSRLIILGCTLHIIMNFAVIILQVKLEIMECGDQ